MTSQLQVAIGSANADAPAVARAGDPAGLSAAHESCRDLRVLQRAAPVRPRTTPNARPCWPRPVRARPTARPGRPGPTWRITAATTRSPRTAAPRPRRSRRGPATRRWGCAARCVNAVADLARGSADARRRVVALTEQARARRPGRAGLDGLLQSRLPRRRAAPVPGGRAGARGVARLQRRTRHPDLQSLADRGAVPAPVPARGGGAPPWRTPTTCWTASGMPLAWLWPHLVNGAGVRSGETGGGARASRGGLGAGRTPRRAAAPTARAGRAGRADVADRDPRRAGDPHRTGRTGPSGCRRGDAVVPRRAGRVAVATRARHHRRAPTPSPSRTG